MIELERETMKQSAEAVLSVAQELSRERKISISDSLKCLIIVELDNVADYISGP